MSTTATVGNRRAPWAWLAMGGLAVGVLDLAFAYAFWKPRGASLGGILQSIAAGWFGERSAAMGATSVAVGLVSHMGIALAFVVAYWFAARRVALLRDAWLPCGLAYGLGLYGVMNFVVLPLSAAGMPALDNTAWVTSSVLMHMVFGALCAWFARAAGRAI